MKFEVLLLPTREEVHFEDHVDHSVFAVVFLAKLLGASPTVELGSTASKPAWYIMVPCCQDVGR